MIVEVLEVDEALMHLQAARAAFLKLVGPAHAQSFERHWTVLSSTMEQIRDKELESKTGIRGINEH